MYDLAFSWCEWLESMPWGIAIRLSSWMYPVVLWVHFAGLCLWLGTTFAVDARLIGVGPKRLTAAELSRELFAWNWIGFAVAFVGGFLLLSAEATTYVQNTGFNVKLAVCFPLALIWHLIVQSRTPAWAAREHTSSVGRWAGVIELALWTSVITASVAFLLTNAVTHP
jgi:hypothetical protein